MIVLLFGPPGCGKGTQATFIAHHFQIPAISTGEMFRVECKAGTPLGQAACSILKSGGLVGDDIVNQIVAKRTRQPDCAGGFLLDGYPRTLEQAKYLDGLLKSRGLPTPVAIFLDVPAQVLISRITARRQCGTCGRIYNMLTAPPKITGICDDDGAALLCREDDTEAVILARLKAYEQSTGSVVSYYNHAGCHRVDGTGTPSQISAEIGELLSRTAGRELAASSR